MKPFEEKKRFGVECFHSPDPPDPLELGNAVTYYDTQEAATQWIEKALQQQRFGYFALYDRASGDWNLIKEYRRSDPAEATKVSQEFGKQAALRAAARNAKRPYTADEIKRMRALLKTRSLRQVAAQLKRTESALRAKAKQLKIKLK